MYLYPPPKKTKTTTTTNTLPHLLSKALKIFFFFFFFLWTPSVFQKPVQFSGCASTLQQALSGFCRASIPPSHQGSTALLAVTSNTSLCALCSSWGISSLPPMPRPLKQSATTSSLQHSL